MNNLDHRNNNNNDRNNDDNDNSQQEDKKADAKPEPSYEKTLTTKIDSDLTLKHKWKVIQQRLPTSQVKNTNAVGGSVKDGVVAVPALSAIDLKLYWEEQRQRGEIPVERSSSPPIWIQTLSNE